MSDGPTPMRRRRGAHRRLDSVASRSLFVLGGAIPAYRLYIARKHQRQEVAHHMAASSALRSLHSASCGTDGIIDRLYTSGVRWSTASTRLARCVVRRGGSRVSTDAGAPTSAVGVHRDGGASCVHRLRDRHRGAVLQRLVCARVVRACCSTYLFLSRNGGCSGSRGAASDPVGACRWHRSVIFLSRGTWAASTTGGMDRGRGTLLYTTGLVRPGRDTPGRTKAPCWRRSIW